MRGRYRNLPPASARAVALLAGLAAAVIVASCGVDAVTGEAPSPASLPSPHGSLTPARVVRITDGDTIRVDVEGREVAVRYIGIDAPERARDGAPAEPLAREATAANAELVEDARIWLETDRDPEDRFGRWLRYAWLETASGWTLVNAALVERGLAEARDYPPNVTRQAQLDTAEDRARADGRGIWGLP